MFHAASSQTSSSYTSLNKSGRPEEAAVRALAKLCVVLLLPPNFCWTAQNKLPLDHHDKIISYFASIIDLNQYLITLCYLLSPSVCA